MWNPDGPAEDVAKVVLAFTRFPSGWDRIVVEPTIGIERLITEVVKDRSVPIVGPGSRNHRELGTGVAAVLSRIGGAFNAKLLQGIDRDESLRRSQRCRGCERSA